MTAKEAEASIRHLVDDLVSANDDDTALTALDLLHKLLTKYALHAYNYR